MSASALCGLRLDRGCRCRRACWQAACVHGVREVCGAQRSTLLVCGDRLGWAGSGSTVGDAAAACSALVFFLGGAFFAAGALRLGAMVYVALRAPSAIAGLLRAQLKFGVSRSAPPPTAVAVSVQRSLNRLYLERSSLSLNRPIRALLSE